MENKYCIIKELILENGAKQNVILVDSLSEIIEFDTHEEANKVAKIFEKNSDLTLRYIVKKI